MNLYEKDEKDMFRRGKSFAIEHQPYKIMNMTISPSEDQLVCSLENNQVQTFPKIFALEDRLLLLKMYLSFQISELQ